MLTESNDSLKAANHTKLPTESLKDRTNGLIFYPFKSKRVFFFICSQTEINYLDCTMLHNVGKLCKKIKRFTKCLHLLKNNKTKIKLVIKSSICFLQIL